MERTNKEPLPYDPGIGGDAKDWKKTYNRARFIAEYLVNVDALSVEDANLMFPEFEFKKETLDKFMRTVADSLYLI